MLYAIKIVLIGDR